MNPPRDQEIPGQMAFISARQRPGVDDRGVVIRFTFIHWFLFQFLVPTAVDQILRIVLIAGSVDTGENLRFRSSAVLSLRTGRVRGQIDMTSTV